MRIEQIIPAGSWVARLPKSGDEDGWRDVQLVGWALLSPRGDMGVGNEPRRVVGLRLSDDQRHVELVDEEALDFGGYAEARTGELTRRFLNDKQALAEFDEQTAFPGR